MGCLERVARGGQSVPVLGVSRVLRHRLDEGRLGAGEVIALVENLAQLEVRLGIGARFLDAALKEFEGGIRLALDEVHLAAVEVDARVMGLAGSPSVKN